MPNDRTGRWREPRGGPALSVRIPQEHVAVHIRGSVRPSPKQPRRVHRGMMPVVTDLRGQRRIQKSLRQVSAAVEGPQKDSDQASPKSTPRRTPPHREKQARGQPTHADVEPPGPQHVPKQRRGAVIVSLGEALDGHPVPSPHAFGARHQGGLVARGRKRSRKIPQVSPWLQVQLRRRKRFGDNRDPKSFQEQPAPLNRPTSEAGAARIRLNRLNNLGTVPRRECPRRASRAALRPTQFGSVSCATAR